MKKLFSNILNKKRRGNTLSELLISLVLVGVVFTIAMGTMVADHHKNQTTVRMKKAYSVLSQAFDSAVAREGSPTNWSLEDGLGEHASYSFFDYYLKPSLILTRDCKNSTKDQCDYTFKELDGTEKALNSTWTRFFLNDGMFVALQKIGNEDYKVIYFYVDTNGKKRLNVVARDIFMFEYWLANKDHPEYIGRFLPFGHEYSRDELISTSNPNNCNNTKNGNYCSALIIKDEWQIIPGYPWAQARYVVQ